MSWSTSDLILGSLCDPPWPGPQEVVMVLCLAVGKALMFLRPSFTNSVLTVNSAETSCGELEAEAQAH